MKRTEKKEKEKKTVLFVAANEAMTSCRTYRLKIAVLSVLFSYLNGKKSTFDIGHELRSPWPSILNK